MVLVRFNPHRRPKLTVKRESILVIEDDDDIRELIEYNLDRGGYRVKSTGDGEDGLRRARQDSPDLVVLLGGLATSRRTSRETRVCTRKARPPRRTSKAANTPRNPRTPLKPNETCLLQSSVSVSSVSISSLSLLIFFKLSKFGLFSSLPSMY